MPAVAAAAPLGSVVPAPALLPPQPADDAPNPSSSTGPGTVLVALGISDQVQFVSELQGLCHESELAGGGSCGVHVMSKNCSCDAYTSALADVTCEEIKQVVGRHAASALEYVLRHYDSLPPTMVFVPATRRHHRVARVRHLLSHAGAGTFDCASWDLPAELRQSFPREPARQWHQVPCVDRNGHPLSETLTANGPSRVSYGDCANFSITDWDGARLFRASPDTFGAWCDQFVGDFNRLVALPTCYHLTFRTTRARLRARSRHSYHAMLVEASVSESAQAYHYVERAAEAIFGDPGLASSNTPRAPKPAWPLSQPSSSFTPDETVAVAMWYDEKARTYGDVTRCVRCPAPVTAPTPLPISQLRLPCTCDVSSFELTRSTDLPLAHRTINMHVANESGFAIVAPVDGARPRHFFPDRSPSWQKIGLLLDMLESGVHDAVLWTDADAAFTPDAGRKLRRLLREHPTSDAIFGTNRPWNAQLNMGVALFRATPRTIAFVRSVAQQDVPESFKPLDQNYTLVDYGGRVRRVDGHLPIDDSGLAEVAHVCQPDAERCDTKVRRLPAFHSIGALCRNVSWARQWEQTCIQGMLTLRAFHEMLESSVISLSLEYNVANVTENLDVVPPVFTKSCPSSRSGLEAASRLHGVLGGVIMVHWAGCNVQERVGGTRALHEMHSEWREKQRGVLAERAGPGAEQNQKGLAEAQVESPRREWMMNVY